MPADPRELAIRAGIEAPSKAKDQTESLRRLASLSLGPTVGVGMVGLSVFVLLASGPRLLGSDGHSGLAVTWAASTILGQGIAIPYQLLVARTYASTRKLPCAPRLGHASRLMLISAALIVLSIYLAVTREHAAWAVGMTLAGWGWLRTARPLGALLGAGAYVHLGRALSLEAIARVFLVAIAWLFPAQAVPLLAVAVGLPLWLSARYARGAVEELKASPNDAGGGIEFQSLAALIAIAVSSQVVANSGALWLASASADAATAGVFVSLSTYMRIPMLLLASLGWVGLQRSATHARAGDGSAVEALVLRTVGLSVGSMLLGVIALILVSDIGLLLFYGPGLVVPGGALLVLGLAATLFSALQTVTQILVGIGRAAAAAVAWAAGAGAATLGYAWSTGILDAAFATLLGTVLVAAALGAAMPSFLRSVGSER